MGQRLSRPLPTSPPPWAAVSSGRRGERDQACQHAGFDKTGSDSLGQPQTFGIVTIYNGASRPPETAETEQSPLVGGLGPSTPGVHPWGKNMGTGAARSLPGREASWPVTLEPGGPRASGAQVRELVQISGRPVPGSPAGVIKRV